MIGTISFVRRYWRYYSDIYRIGKSCLVSEKSLIAK